MLWYRMRCDVMWHFVCKQQNGVCACVRVSMCLYNSCLNTSSFSLANWWVFYYRWHWLTLPYMLIWCVCCVCWAYCICVNWRQFQFHFVVYRINMLVFTFGFSKLESVDTALLGNGRRAIALAKTMILTSSTTTTAMIMMTATPTTRWHFSYMRYVRLLNTTQHSD